MSNPPISLTTEDLLGIIVWLEQGDVGISAKTLLYCKLNLEHSLQLIDAPYDYQDFYRCMLLDHSFPQLELRSPENIKKVVEKEPRWQKWFDAWDELTSFLSKEKKSSQELEKIYFKYHIIWD